MKTDDLDFGVYQNAEGKRYQVLGRVTSRSTDTLVHDGSSTRTSDGPMSFTTACGIDVNTKNENFVTLDGVVLTPVE